MIKLNYEIAEQIRQSPLSDQYWSEKLGVNRRAIRSIRKHESWQHPPNPSQTPAAKYHRRNKAKINMERAIGRAKQRERAETRKPRNILVASLRVPIKQWGSLCQP